MKGLRWQLQGCELAGTNQESEPAAGGNEGGGGGEDGDEVLDGAEGDDVKGDGRGRGALPFGKQGLGTLG